MRAIVVDEPGGIDRLRLADLPEPEPGPGQAVIDVAFAAANWSDIQKREGVYPDPVRYPAVLGLEVSGTVAGVGPGVDDTLVGRRVAAITGPSMLGGYAERVVVGADFLIELPDPMSLEIGAAFPVVALTAYHLINSAYRLAAGETILVHAIGGAVGLAVTQLAVAKGATVIGTVGSSAKAKRPRDLGASLVIDRGREDFVDAVRAHMAGKGVDLVIDSLGGDELPRGIGLLKTYGHAINIGEAAGYPDFDIRSKLYENSTSLAGFELVHALRVPGLWRRAVDSVISDIASGQLDVPIEGVFPLADVQSLHRKLESRSVSGKLLIDVAGDA